MNYMFYNCTSLLSLNLNNFNTSSVINMEGMFSNCYSLISLNLFYFNTTSVINMNNLFLGCSEDLIYCINENNTNNIFSQINPDKNNCSDICFTKDKQMKINKDKKCIVDCVNDDIYRYEYNNICYKTCPNGTYSSLFNNYICIEECPYDLPYLKDNNECVKNCNASELFNNKCRLINVNIQLKVEDKKDTIINNIKEQILHGELDNILSSIDKGEDIVISHNDTIYTLITTSNQRENKNNSVSSINLGECERILKDYYNINNNESLIIFKIDKYEDGLSMPIIEYEVYEPRTKNKLNLSICRDVKINISLPEILNIHEKVYIPAIMNNENIYSNMILCDKGCIFKGYSSNNQKIECECNSDNHFPLPFINEIFNTIEGKDEKIKYIKKELLNGSFDQLISNYIFGKKIDLLNIEQYMINRITSFENQKNNILFRSLENSQSKLLSNISTINFKECEEKIKKYYNINDTDSLIIYISEYFENGLLIDIIEYEIINIKEKKYINLNICKGLTTENEYLV